MNIKKLLLLVFILFSSSIIVFPQSRAVKKANLLFESGSYNLAKDRYQKILKKSKNAEEKAEVTFKLAECFRYLNDPKKSAPIYKRLVRMNYQDPLAVLYYADALKMLEKYEDALEQYKLYTTLVPDDPRGKNGVQACEIVANWIENPTRHIITNLEIVNSKQSDFSPVYAREDGRVIYFTSAREGSKGEDLNQVSGWNFTDLYFSMQDKKGDWSEPDVVPGQVNSDFDEGAASLDSKYGTMFFTSCKILPGKDMGCLIYKSTRTDKEWSLPEVVTIFEDSAISVGHPCLSPDGLELYFVAGNSAEGGNGGKDIWKVKRASETDEWGKPQNLGDEINTPGDELYPYLHTDGALYFSSNGHIGIGGLDIFKASKNDDGKWQVENLMYPMNSNADDFGIIFIPDKNSGLFTSNRKGSNEDDIYSFALPELIFKVKGIVKDAATDQPIAKATVKMLGSEGTELEAETNKEGTFDFDLIPENDYLFTTTKENYFKGKGEETTRGIKEDKTIAITIYMTPVSENQVFEVENIEYDLNQATLRPESMVSLDELVVLLDDNSNVAIELSAHTDYQGSDELNTDLSNRRAQSVVDYLILKGIDSGRLVAKGYGETAPNVVSKKLTQKYDFLSEGDTLTEKFITSLPDVTQQAVANQINRRTEFKILSMDYKEGTEIQQPKKEIEKVEEDEMEIEKNDEE